MKTTLLSALLFISLNCLALPAVAFDGLGVSGGYSSSDDVSFFRGAIKFDPEWKLFDEGSWHLGLYFDLGFIFLNSDSDVVNINDDPDSLQAASLTPLFRLQRAAYQNTIAPFIEAGVGAAFFSEDRLQNSEPEGLDFGGTFQFEDILAAGIRFGEYQQFEASINYFHYSNFDVYDKNDGIDIVSATFSLWL